MPEVLPTAQTRSWRLSKVATAPVPTCSHLLDVRTILSALVVPSFSIAVLQDHDRVVGRGGVGRRLLVALPCTRARTGWSSACTRPRHRCRASETNWALPAAACQNSSFCPSTLIPQATAFMLRSPIWRPTEMPTGPESMVKTICAPARSIADSSAVTSVATAEGCQVPTTSIFIAGRFFCAAAIRPSVQTAFSARIATFGARSSARCGSAGRSCPSPRRACARDRRPWSARRGTSTCSGRSSARR